MLLGSTEKSDFRQESGDDSKRQVTYLLPISRSGGQCADLHDRLEARE